MNRTLSTALVTATLLTASSAFAQAAATPAPGPTAEVLRSYNSLKANILKSADKMPADLYSYKPLPDIRTFARVLTHVIEAQVGGCGVINKTPPEARVKTPAETAPKAEIVAALKASYDECDKAYATLTDTNMGDMLPAGKVTRSRIGILWGNVSHDNEQYAQLATYMRLKNITPPSASEK